jgi:probable LLM family oxidoreductase
MSQPDGKTFEFGLYTFGEILPDPVTGDTISAEQRIRNIIETAKLAEEAGLDVFGLGEHHRLDFAVSAPHVVLAAIAQTTKRILLTSAATILSTEDPVRVFEEYATLDLVSGGRAEIMVARGAFFEPFPLFGYDLELYDELFSEKFELLQELNRHERVTWSGKHRPSLHQNEIAPRPKQRELPIWLGVGGSKESALRAGQAAAGCAIAILRGSPEPFKPLADEYRQAGAAAGHPPHALRVAITSHGFVGKNAEQAVNHYFPYYANYKMMRSGRKVEKAELFEAVAAHDALAVGGPDEIVEKILYQHEMFGHDRYLLQIDIGQPLKQVAEAIELLATKVAPAVRKAIAAGNASKA